MRLRDIIGLLIALILAIGVAFLTRYFLTKDTGITDEKGVVQEVASVKILVAAKPLHKGNIITRGDLQWQYWPEKALHPAYVKEGAVTLESLVGTVVKAPLDPGEPVHLSDLVNPGGKGILAAIVAPGKRAFSIKLTPESASSGLITPGDYVDVILSTTEFEGGKTEGKGEVIAENVKVLAMDVEMASSAKAPKPPPTVATLEVTAEEAEHIAAGVREGSVSLSLHSLAQSDEPSTPKEKREEESKPKENKVIIMRGKEKTEVQVQEY